MFKFKKNAYDRNELLAALSLALDLAGWLPLNHATRTAHIALHIARTMGLREAEVQDIYVAVFFHDLELVGTARAEQAKQGVDTQLMNSAPNGIGKFLDEMPFSPRAGEYVRWHHASWDDVNEQASIPIGAQILRLADLLELRYDRTRSYDEQRDEHRSWVWGQSGGALAPAVVEAFFTVSAREKFWLDFTSDRLDINMRDVQPDLTAQLTQYEVAQVANVFAGIIDSKSRFTYNHSRGVAALMERLAPRILHSEEDIFRLKIAALLHDLGKLAVPTEILDKPGQLTPREFEQIKAHPYYTKAILGRVKGFEVIKEWAGNHHENIDGSGYPEHKSKLATPERLMTVADVYQALTEERPYRAALSTSQALEIMYGMVKQGKLCANAVELLIKVV